MDFKKAAEQIFLAGVAGVLPDKLIRKEVRIKEDTLFISSLQFPLHAVNRIFVVGAGKASALMAKEIEDILGDRISGGHIVVKYGHASALKYISIHEGGHPVPDDNGYLATQKIIETVARAKENDLILCLLSGGGSALLADFPKAATLHDIITTNHLLLTCGASIREINTVRKHLSNVKGGQLAKLAHPAFLVSLILSDVIGDPLDAIASGPTVPDPTTFEEAMQVLTKYDLLCKIPLPLVDHLKKGIKKTIPETPKPGNSVFNNATNLIIGSNKIALEAASQKAIALGLNSLIISSALEGNTPKVAEQLVTSAMLFQNDKAIRKPCALLFGGETTLQVNGRGSGGRNQHLALYASLLLAQHPGITILCAGTDGSDGPTAAAGAVVDSATTAHALTLGVDANQFLNNFDSFHFFQKAGGHVITGPTMTNVMDLMVVIIA